MIIGRLPGPAPRYGQRAARYATYVTADGARRASVDLSDRAPTVQKVDEVAAAEQSFRDAQARRLAASEAYLSRVSQRSPHSPIVNNAEVSYREACRRRKSAADNYAARRRAKGT